MGTGTSEDVLDLFAIGELTLGEGMPGIEPGSPDPKSSLLPLRHCGGAQNKDNECCNGCIHRLTCMQSSLTSIGEILPTRYLSWKEVHIFLSEQIMITRPLPVPVQ